MLIDTHAHLHMQEFDKDRDAVVKRAKDLNVDFINVSFNPEGNVLSAQVAEKYGMFWTAGVHPHHADQCTDAYLHSVADAKKSPAGSRLIALGEIGMDFFRNLQPRQEQQKAFRSQLSLARELHLPVIIHCRDAFPDVFKILKGAGNKAVVLHCFAGGPAEAEYCWEHGYYTSFTATCTYPGAHKTREVIGAAPLKKIMVETDCPFLPPQGMRGKRNEPAFIRETFSKICGLRPESPNEIEDAIFENTKLFFNLPYKSIDGSH